MPRIRFTETLLKLAAVFALLVFGMRMLPPQPSGWEPSVKVRWESIQTP